MNQHSIRTVGAVLCVWGVAGVFALFLWGCAAPRSTSPHTAVLPIGESNLANEHAAAREVEEASKMIDAGDASTVIPRLLRTISKYPSSPAASDARYLLGMAYYRIGSYRDAIELFNEYLHLSPDGRYAKAASEQVARLSTEYSNKYPTPEQLDSQIQQKTEQVKASPQDVQQTQDLAELLWKRGNYDKAGSLYASLIKCNPALMQDPTIKSRIELLPNGDYTVLSPVEVERRQAKMQPLSVINTASFRSGQDLLTREARYYNVTGQVVNRGDSVLYGVQVNVTIYGLGGIVYDTNMVSIGRMSPGEIRAFSVRFSNFDSIDNVNHFECVATFQR